MIEVNLTEEQATELQNAVDLHMERCYAVLDWDEEEDIPQYLDDVALYCGCHVCETREHIVAVMNWFRENEILDVAVV